MRVLWGILFSKKPFNIVLDPRLSSTGKSKIQKFAESRPERDAENRDEMAAKFRRINERRKNESLIKDFFTFPFGLWRSAWAAPSIRTFLESEREIDRLQRSLFYSLEITPLFATGTDFFRTRVTLTCVSVERVTSSAYCVSFCQYTLKDFHRDDSCLLRDHLRKASGWKLNAFSLSIYVKLRKK